LSAVSFAARLCIFSFGHKLVLLVSPILHVCFAVRVVFVLTCACAHLGVAETKLLQESSSAGRQVGSPSFTTRFGSSRRNMSSGRAAAKVGTPKATALALAAAAAAVEVVPRRRRHWL